MLSIALCHSLSSLCSSCSVALLLLCVCVSEPNLAASPSSCSTVRRSNWYRQCERTDTQTPSVLLPSLPHSVVSLTRPSTFSPTKEEEKHSPSLTLLSHHSLAPINLHRTEMQNTLAFSFSQLFSVEDIWSIFNELPEMDSVTYSVYVTLAFLSCTFESAHFFGLQKWV